MWRSIAASIACVWVRASYVCPGNFFSSERNHKSPTPPTIAPTRAAWVSVRAARAESEVGSASEAPVAVLDAASNSCASLSPAAPAAAAPATAHVRGRAWSACR